jgi:hypothetical protein
MAEIPVIPFAFANSLSCATVILLKSCAGASAFGATFAAFGVGVSTLAAGFCAFLAGAAFFAPEAVMLSIWISVKAWR